MKKWLPTILTAFTVGLTAVSGTIQQSLTQSFSAHPAGWMMVTGVVAIVWHLLPSPVQKSIEGSKQ